MAMIFLKLFLIKTFLNIIFAVNKNIYIFALAKAKR